LAETFGFLILSWKQFIAWKWTIARRPKVIPDIELEGLDPSVPQFKRIYYLWGYFFGKPNWKCQELDPQNVAKLEIMALGPINLGINPNWGNLWPFLKAHTTSFSYIKYPLCRVELQLKASFWL